jgi:hypothetical protein
MEGGARENAVFNMMISSCSLPEIVLDGALCTFPYVAIRLDTCRNDRLAHAADAGFGLVANQGLDCSNPVARHVHQKDHLAARKWHARIAEMAMRKLDCKAFTHDNRRAATVAATAAQHREMQHKSCATCFPPVSVKTSPN